MVSNRKPQAINTYIDPAFRERLSRQTNLAGYRGRYPELLAIGFAAFLCLRPYTKATWRWTRSPQTNSTVTSRTAFGDVKLNGADFSSQHLLICFERLAASDLVPKYRDGDRGIALLSIAYLEWLSNELGDDDQAGDRFRRLASGIDPNDLSLQLASDAKPAQKVKNEKRFHITAKVRSKMVKWLEGLPEEWKEARLCNQQHAAAVLIAEFLTRAPHLRPDWLFERPERYATDTTLDLGRPWRLFTCSLSDWDIGSERFTGAEIFDRFMDLAKSPAVPKIKSNDTGQRTLLYNIIRWGAEELLPSNSVHTGAGRGCIASITASHSKAPWTSRVPAHHLAYTQHRKRNSKDAAGMPRRPASFSAPDSDPTHLLHEAWRRGSVRD